MIEQFRKSVLYWLAALSIVLVVGLTGCETLPKNSDATQESGNMFHNGDLITVKAVPPSSDITVIPDHTERIGDDGKISLLYVGQVTAAGKTASQLQAEIYALYVPKLYKGLNVTVYGELRYFYVDGEVRAPGQKEYPGDMTVVKAISVAGGFTEFAKKTKVQLTHAGHTKNVNVQKAINDSRYDAAVYPGDRINVSRRVF